MDAHVFRLLVKELESLLQGGRVEKIHSPAAGLLTLVAYKAGRKFTLVLRHDKVYNHGLGLAAPLRREKTRPALYLTRQKIPNPEKPSTLVMTLRKHLAGRVLGQATPDWVNRRVFFFVPTGKKNGPPQDARSQSAPLWFCLDLVAGPSLHHELPDIAAPQWPAPVFTADAPGRDPAEAVKELLSQAAWRAYPVLTPALRKTLPALEPLEAAALLADLQYDAEQGGGELYFYTAAAAPALLSTWPLPPSLGAGLEASGTTEGIDAPYPGLELARRVYEPEILAWLGADERKEHRAALTAEEKRLNKILLKLDQEEERLHGLIRLRQQGVLLQALLWRLNGADKIARLDIAPEDSPDGQAHSLELDAAKSLAENMAGFFKQSARGKRGLLLVEKRRLELRAELERLKAGFAPAPRSGGQQRQDARNRAGSQAGDAKTSDPLRLIQRFVSSDGFIILRGKSALGNQALLKLAQPHDLWLHAQGGPSAHVIIRRDQPGQEVPELTLLQAGTLAAVKSWRKNDGRAEIISALVKDVRPVKGGAPGEVLVSQIRHGFVADVDHELEKNLLKA